ncbi:protein CMSS1-like isoform X2 [Liolophura sinensis]|uniref:protein CMSS1-like isoform X2 n=1 Tax=Liolophura sinensis TaxID=3198878 RepID=UPI0031592911
MADDLGEEWWLGDKTDELSDHSSLSEDDYSPSMKKQRISPSEDNQRSLDDGSDSPAQATEKAPEMKKQKKRRRKRITEDIKENPPSAGRPQDMLSVIEKQFQGKLSQVEWDEMQLNADSHFGKSNTENLETSPYLKMILPKWSKMVKKGDKTEPDPGSPLVLLIASSAIRSVDLVRQVSDFRDNKGKLAKLFAKHAKLEEQQNFLKKTVIHLGIGTPNRIKKLLDTGHLHLSRTSAVVLDWNWRNVKLKTLMDIPELRQDLMELFREHIFPHVRNNACTLYLM